MNKKRKSSIKKYFFTFIILLFSSCGMIGEGSENFKVHHGVLDAQGWIPQKNGTLFLEGSWKFYTRRLLTPPEVHRGSFSNTWMNVPGVWTARYPKINYATYDLRIQNLEDRPYDLKVYDMGHAYKMWLNGRLILSNGQVATNQSGFRNDYHVKTYHSLRPQNGQVELVVQVANFSGWRAGIWKGIYLGIPSQIDKLTFEHFSRDLIVFGFLFALGLYHLFLIFSKQKDVAAFALGLTAIFLGMKILPEGERMIYYIFPHISGDWVIRLAYIGYYGLVLLFPTFISILFNRQGHLVLSIQRILSMMFIVTLFFPMKVFSFFLPFSHVVTLFGVSGIFIILIQAVRERQRDALLMLVIFVFFVGTGINDILNSMEIIQTAFIIYYGFTFILLAQGWILSTRFSRAFQENALLKEENYRAYLKEKELNELKSQFLSTASHEFKTPLAVIQTSVDLFQHHWDKMTLQKRRDYFDKIDSSINRITSMMNDVLYLSHAESRDWVSQKQTMDPVAISADVMREIRFSYGKSEKEVFLEIEGQKRFVESDPATFRLIMTNLVSNAVKYSLDMCKVSVTIEFLEKGLKIRVCDKGMGISKKEQTHIFERFYRTENVRNHIPGTGLGLAIVQKSVENLNGLIELHSEVGKGTCFEIEFSELSEEQEDRGVQV